MRVIYWAPLAFLVAQCVFVYFYWKTGLIHSMYNTFGIPQVAENEIHTSTTRSPDESQQGELDMKDESPVTKPHIVFVVADDLGWNDIGFHNDAIRSPTLDKLARNGVILDNYYVQPTCSPSRSQLLSGKYQIHTGMQHNPIKIDAPRGLPVGTVTIADQLRMHDYATHAVGKWHIGFYTWAHMPTRRGFDSFLGFFFKSRMDFVKDSGSTSTQWEGETCIMKAFFKVMEATLKMLLLLGEVFYMEGDWSSLRSNVLPGHVSGLSDYYKKERCQKMDGIRECGLAVYDNETIVRDNMEYSAHFYTRRAQQIVERHPKDKPLFLYLSYQNMHSPMQVPAEYEAGYDHMSEKPKRRTFAGMVTCIDEGVKNLTDTLKERGLWDNTVFIFTTDNGGKTSHSGNNWPLRGGKYSYFEGGVRAVGFVNSALLRNPAEIRGGLMHISDWYPTLLHLAGGQLIESTLDGYDMWQMISNAEKSSRIEILYNIDPKDAKLGDRMFPNLFDTRITAAIRNGEWKLLTGKAGKPGKRIRPPESPNIALPFSEEVIFPAKQNLFLFNIQSDPYEVINLAERYPHIVKRLLRRLDVYNETSVPCIKPPDDMASRPSLHNGSWVPWQ